MSSLLPIIADLGELRDNTPMLMVVMTICGILVVFVGLILLIFVIGLFGKVTSSLNGDGKKKSDKPAKKSVVPDGILNAAKKNEEFKPVPVPGDIPGEIIAVIAAAVASLEDGNTYTVRSVRRAQDGRPAWSMAGLMDNTRPF